MADDIITIGGPGRAGRDPKRNTGETVETLFRSHYARLVRMAFEVAEDWAAAEFAAREAFIRLARWWRWRMAHDEDTAVQFLENTAKQEARAAAPGDESAPPAARASPGGQGEDSQDSGDVDDLEERAIDVHGAWLEFEALLSKAVRKARVRLALATGAAVLVAAAGVTISAVAFSQPRPPHPGICGRGTSCYRVRISLRNLGGPNPFFSTGPAAANVHPGPLTSALQMQGIVAVVHRGHQLWAVRRIWSFGHMSRYQIIKIDPAKKKRRINLGVHKPAVTAGHGSLWATTSSGRLRGQVVRIDPATGRVIGRLHLPGTQCRSLAYGGGYLYAGCGTVGPATDTVFERVDPNSGRVAGQADPVGAPGLLAASPGGLWFSSGSGISGLIGTPFGSSLIPVTTAGHRVSLRHIKSLQYAYGAVWALTGNESVARINPATGWVNGVYTYRTYDPADGGQMRALTVADGSLWFLDDAAGLTSVLRVSAVTGWPVARVPLGVALCGSRPCAQIYSAAGAIWVPTQSQLFRIDPSGVSSRPKYPTTLHRD